jgi:DNA-binding protein HU-beta
MNKKELVVRLSKTVGLSQARSMKVINALFDAEEGTGILVQEILAGNKVTIPGFGTFGAKVRAGRRGVNPSTGTHMEIKPKRHAYFKVGKNLKEKVLAAEGEAGQA